MNESTRQESGESMDCRPTLREQYKFNIWLAVTTATYLVTLFLVQHFKEWSPLVQVSVTLLPVLPGLMYLGKGLRLLRQMDELQRRIQLEAWFFAAIGTVIVSAVINVFNAHGLVWETFPHGLEIGGTYLLMFFLWTLGVAFSTRRYQ
jgi:hypothetical protein